ncbi:uncharacterized protein [Nerophis lumbriciformis]|uniref:uncharacterized protein n=1 Tax=Nerophis lumbriciformis TaxID=546530 RepID=UPI003BADA540
MRMRDVWRNYKVLIVMGSSLVLIHVGWYQLKSNPRLRQHRKQEVAADDATVSRAPWKK